MGIYSTQSRMTLSDPAAAIEKWVLEAQAFGGKGHGVVFCSSHKDLDVYLRTVESGFVMPSYVRSRTAGGVTRYVIATQATLTLFPVSFPQDAAQAATEQWPFMVFHNPAQWPNRSTVRLLLPRLIPSIGSRTTLISVGTVMPPADSAPEAASAPKEIDYMAITKAMIGR